MTQFDTKIFIDTNIFLGLYNSNDSGNVEAFMRSLFNNRNLLVTTEQSYKEYLRNRTRIINEFKSSFVASKTKEQLLLAKIVLLRRTKNISYMNIKTNPIICSKYVILFLLHSHYLK